jgi:hypothetical protein
MGGTRDGGFGTQARSGNASRGSGGSITLDVFGAGDPPGVLVVLDTTITRT